MTTLDKLAPALIKAQAEMPAVPMDGYNPFYKSRYATLGAVISATRGVLARHGLAITQQVISSDQADAIGIRTVLIHESGQTMTWDAVIKIPSGGNPGQEAGKLITYLRRYSLAAALNIYADEDIDANSPKQQKRPVLTLEDAGKVTNRDGGPYTEIEPERLAHMSRSIDKAIKTNGHNPERLQILKTKLAAIKTIEATRAGDD